MRSKIFNFKLQILFLTTPPHVVGGGGGPIDLIFQIDRQLKIRKHNVDNAFDYIDSF